jgi:hypothetical protein
MGTLAHTIFSEEPSLKGVFPMNHLLSPSPPHIKAGVLAILVTMTSMVVCLCLPTRAALAHPLDPPGPRPTCLADQCTGKDVRQTNCQNSDWARDILDTPITITRSVGDQPNLPTPGPEIRIGTAQHWVSSGCNAHWLTVKASSPYPVTKVAAEIVCPPPQATCPKTYDPSPQAVTAPTRGFFISTSSATTITTPMVGLLSDPADYNMLADIAVKNVPFPFHYNDPILHFLAPPM